MGLRRRTVTCGSLEQQPLRSCPAGCVRTCEDLGYLLASAASAATNSLSARERLTCFGPN